MKMGAVGFWQTRVTDRLNTEFTWVEKWVDQSTRPLPNNFTQYNLCKNFGCPPPHTIPLLEKKIRTGMQHLRFGVHHFDLTNFLQVNANLLLGLLFGVLSHNRHKRRIGAIFFAIRRWRKTLAAQSKWTHRKKGVEPNICLQHIKYQQIVESPESQSG